VLSPVNQTGFGWIFALNPLFAFGPAGDHPSDACASVAWLALSAMTGELLNLPKLCWLTVGLSLLDLLVVFTKKN
jgi:hypothetical protein